MNLTAQAPAHVIATPPRELLTQLYNAAVRAALPAHTLAAHVSEVLAAPPKGRTVVVGAGKAAGAMAHALDALWPQHLALAGAVVTRYHHTPPLPPALVGRQRIEVLEASHPVPDAAGFAAAQRTMALVQGLGADDLVIALVSGGGSALLTLPIEGLTLEDKQRINRELLASGAGIDEMNTVRKHLSRVKGGQLAAACGPARVLTLLISDVPGDAPEVIASGPTVADASTSPDALRLAKRYRLSVPAAVLQAWEQGGFETPKPGAPLWQRHETRMLATPQMSLEAAAQAARAMGLNAYVLSDEIEGESREVGKVHAALARAAAKGQGPFQKPCVILSGGETTVTAQPQVASGQAKGRGGRAGEFCLGLTHGLQSQSGVWALAADTDGIDGSEGNAGAFVQPDTLASAVLLGRSLPDHIDRNDSYGFFEALGDLHYTGPTHTNVNDFRALLVL